jgi:hypothetical protein
LNSTRPIANGKENGNIHEIGTQFSIACRWYGIAARRLADLEKCVLVSPILVSRAEVDDLRSLRRLLCERMQGARKSRESMTNYAAAKEHGDESKMDLVRQGLRMRLDKAFGDHNLLHLE